MFDWATLWREILRGDERSWVAFDQGTCVILKGPSDDPGSDAALLLAQWGPFQEGTPAGDFGVTHLKDRPGWVVTGHHPDLLTYVDPEELKSPAPDDFSIGMIGLAKRDYDSHRLLVAHVEEKRG